MFGHKHGGCGGWAMAARMGRGRHGGPFSGGGPFGRDHGGPFRGRGRGPRMFDSGSLRLVVLGLIAEEPRHGYDIIKALEAKFQGAYSPSPGAIYPMLQMMEEADLVASSADGNKRLYSITEQGRGYLAEQQAELDRLNEQIEEASAGASDVALGDEVRALKWLVYSRLRDGSLGTEQAKKALEILRKARKDLGEI